MCRRGGSSESELRRHRVEPALAPGVATHDAPTAQRRTAQGTVPAQRLQGVGRAGRLEPTGVAQPRLEQPSVGQHDTDQQLAWPQRRRWHPTQHRGEAFALGTHRHHRDGPGCNGRFSGAHGAGRPRSLRLQRWPPAPGAAVPRVRGGWLRPAGANAQRRTPRRRMGAASARATDPAASPLRAFGRRPGSGASAGCGSRLGAPGASAGPRRSRCDQPVYPQAS